MGLHRASGKESGSYYSILVLYIHVYNEIGFPKKTTESHRKPPGKAESSHNRKPVLRLHVS